jgi:hypothetical protein
VTSTKEKIKRRSRLQAEMDICLRGDLAGQYEQLQRQLAELPANNKLGGDPERQRIQAEMEHIRAEMVADTIPFVLRAISEPAFQELVDQHPPRRNGDEINARDAAIGFNRSTFYHALIRACVIEPDDLDDEDWDVLFSPDGFSPGEFHRLGNEALRINDQAVDVPFSPAGSSENPD